MYIWSGLRHFNSDGSANSNLDDLKPYYTHGRWTTNYSNVFTSSKFK